MSKLTHELAIAANATPNITTAALLIAAKDAIERLTVQNEGYVTMIKGHIAT